MELPWQDFDATQISPTRDTRLRWMQSVIHCTHYIAGASEREYLNEPEAPEIAFVPRIEIPDQRARTSATDGLSPVKNRHHLLSARWRERHSRDCAWHGAGGAKS